MAIGSVKLRTKRTNLSRKRAISGSSLRNAEIVGSEKGNKQAPLSLNNVDGFHLDFVFGPHRPGGGQAKDPKKAI
jgi:hypothetical protein